MSAREFFSLTPRLLIELRKQWLNGRRETQTMLALLRKDIINFSMGHPKRPVTLEDLLPPEPGRHQGAPRRMSPKRRQAVANRIRGVFGPLVVAEGE